MDTSGHIIPQQEVIITSLAAKQTWIARTYGEGAVNSDAYYQENLVVGDLPAGHYTVWIDFAGVEAEQEIEIRPGLVSYFYFWGRDGFEVTLPPLPGAEFTPQPAASEIAEKP